MIEAPWGKKLIPVTYSFVWRVGNFGVTACSFSAAEQLASSQLLYAEIREEDCEVWDT